MNQFIESNVCLNTSNNNNNNNSTIGKRLRLRRPNHSNELITGLNESLKDECFTDATVVCEEKPIRVHRIILSLFSQYFKRMFELMSNTNPCHYPLIAIKNIPFVDLKAIIEFIYRGEVSIPKQQLNSLLKSAEELEIEGLRSHNCKDFSTINKMQYLGNNSNVISLNNNMVNNHPIIASNLLSIPSKSLKWDFSPSPKRKCGRKTIKRIVNTNSSFIPTNSTQINSNLSLNNENYSLKSSSLSIINLVPVSHNSIKTCKRIPKNQKEIVFVKTPKTPQKSGLISVANDMSSSGCISIDLQQNQNLENECENSELILSANISTINDKLVMNSLNTSNNCGFEGLDKLYSLSNEGNGTDRKCFLDKLIAFHSSNGTPIAFCPTINRQPLDLFRLYLAVKEKGGYEKVTKDELWIECTSTCKVAHSTSAAYALRLHYKKHLLPFECQYDRNGIDPNIVLKSLEKCSQSGETDDPQNQVNYNQTPNETVVKNNCEQIEEIWIEDDDECESLTSHSKQDSELLSSSDSIPFSNSSQIDETVKSLTPSTSISNKNIILRDSVKYTTSFRSQNLYNSFHRTFANETNSIKRNLKANYPYLKCSSCKKVFGNHLLYNLHVKNNCMKAKTTLIEPNIIL